MPYYSLKSQPNPLERKEASKPQKQPQNDDLSFMTVAEVAKLLRIGPMTVYRLADRGELPSYKILRKRLFKHQDVMAYIEKCAVPSWKH